MAKYQSVLNSAWDDPVFQHWSSDGKLLFMNLITSSRHNPAGIYAVTPAALMFETSLTPERFQAAFEEIQQPSQGYPRVRYDAERSVVWVVNALKHQPGLHPNNKNLQRCIESVLRQYADSPLVADFLDVYESRHFGALLHGFKASLKGLRRGCLGAGKTPNKDKSKDKDTGVSQERGVPGRETAPRTPHLPHQQLIDRFLQIKGVDVKDRTQVSAWYKRHSRSAVALIKESGGLDQALAAMECLAREFDRKGLSWTLDTVAKHLPDVHRSRGGQDGHRPGDDRANRAVALRSVEQAVDVS